MLGVTSDATLGRLGEDGRHSAHVAGQDDVLVGETCRVVDRIIASR